MIVGNGGRLVSLIGPIWKPLALLTAFAALVAVTHAVGLTWLVPQDVPLPLLGTGLVVFLGLRNNTAYARWWEARGLWGSVVNQSRSFARTVSTVLPLAEGGEVRRVLILHQIAWAMALRMSLRGEDVRAGLQDFLSAEDMKRLDRATNLPFAIQREIGDILSDELKGERIAPVEFLALNTILNALTDAQGGLERIRNTPMPQHYAQLPSAFVMLYGVLLPFGVAPDLGLATPVACLIINALFLTLDRAGANLENPFARSIHDLPMSAITRTVEIDLKETIEHENRPAPLRAVLGVLR